MKPISKIEKRRVELGLTQTQLAEKIGVTQGAISLIEIGARLPSLTMLVKIAAALECSAGDLIESNEIIKDGETA